MIVRALDRNHDWLFGKGRNDYLSGSAAIGQNIDTRLLCWIGDCFFDTKAGIDWINLLGSGQNQMALNLALAAVILNTQGVTALQALKPSFLPSTRLFTASYTVTTIYSRYSSSVQLNANATG